VAVTNNLTLIHACETATDATTSCVLTSTSGGSFLSGGGEFVQGSAAYGFDLDVETHTVTFTPTASINLSGQTIWVWLQLLTPTFLDTWANGGVLCRLSDGTNYSEWYLAGDNTASTYTRHSFSTSTTPDAISGTLTVTAVTVITFYFTGVTKSKLPENCFIDYLQYGADGTGMTVSGGTFATPETFSDVEGDDVTAAVGMLSESNGVYYLNGPITFGDTGTASTYFEDGNQLLSSIDHYRSFTTSNRTSAESLVSSTHNTIKVVGNSTGVNSFALGSKTGTLGYAGCTIKTGGNRRIIFTCTDVNVDILRLYGNTFINLGAISFLPDKGGGDTEVISNSFNGCDQINPDTCVFQNNIIAATNDANGGLLVDSSGSTNQQNLTFISGGTGHGLYITSTGTYSLTVFNFSGYGSTGTTDAAVYNNSGGLVTLNVSGAASPTYRNGAGASTTINNNITVTYNNLVNGSEIRIYNAGTSTLIDGIESVTGNSFSWSVGAGVSMDIKIFGPVPTPPSPPALAYLEIIQKAISYSVSTTLKINQQINRNYYDGV